MDVKITQLDNGLTVVTDYMPHLKSVALGVWVNAGSREEYDNEHGLAHLLEHMAFKGTTKRDAYEIAEEIEAVGGELNAATSVENTAYYARVLSEHIPLAIDILSDILQNSVFDEEELAKEQHVILQEIGASLDTPEDLVFDRFQETAFPNQPIGRPILGTPESVSGFNSSAISAYLNRHYRSGAMVVSAAGDIEHEAFKSIVANHFQNLPSGKADPVSPSSYVGGEFIEDHDLREAQILLGFEGCAFEHADFFTMQFVAAVLGGGMSSRLFQQVREKRGLCYSIHAFHWPYCDTGLLGVHAATGGEDVGALMPVILDELERVSIDLSDHEVKKAKAQMRAGLLMNLESPAARATQIARHIMIFGRYITPDEQLERIEAVTTENIKQLAHRVFSSSRPTLAAIGPVKDMIGVEHIIKRLHITQAAE